MDAKSSNLLYLWPRRTLFVGRVSQPIQFSQAAASLVIGVEGRVTATMPSTGGPLIAHSLLLGPGQKMKIETSGHLLAACYLDALGQDYRLLLAAMEEVSAGVFRGLPGEESLRHFLVDLHQTPLPTERAYAGLEARINPNAKAYPSSDPRIEKVIGLIRDNIATNVSAEALAQEVNLSVSRLVELFREQVGVPIRRYRQWHRLFVTFTAVHEGESLTEAALAAGFTDSAHFSHTFRMTLGMKPSDILAMLSGRLFVGNEQD